MSLVNLAHVCSHLQNASLARLGLTSVPYSKLHLQIALLLQRQGFFSTVDIAGPSPPLARLPPGTQDVHQTLSTNDSSIRREQALSLLVKHRQELEAKSRRRFSTTTPQEITADVESYAQALPAKDFSKEDVEWALSHSGRTERDILTEGVDVEAMGIKIEGQPLDMTTRNIDTLSEGVITQQNRASRRLWLGLKYWNGEPVLRKASLISKPSKRMWLRQEDFLQILRGNKAGEVKGITKIGEVIAITTDKGIMDIRECVERQIGGQPLARFY